MKDYKANNIRNIVVVGHQGSGKTSLMEAVLFYTGVINKKGSTALSNTVSDYSKEEKARQVSIRTSLIPVEYRDTKINFLDTPGTFDFVSEVLAPLRVARAGIIIVDATKGVEPGTKKVYRYLRQHSIPTLIVINKIYKEGADYDKVLEGLRHSFGRKVVPFNYLEGDKLVNAIESKEPSVVELASEIDDALTEKFLMEEPIEVSEIKESLINGIRKGLVTPVVITSSAVSSPTNLGVQELLDILVDYFPSSAEPKVKFNESSEEYEISERVISETAPVTAYVFKTDVDPFVGKLSYVYLNSGSLSKGQAIFNSTLGVKETIGNVLILRGKDQIEVSKLVAGDIGIVTKTNSLETGNTIVGEKDNFVYPETIKITPFISFALEVKSKNDEGKISEALKKIGIEDLSISVERNSESKQLIIGLQGQAHLDYVVEKLKNIYNVEVKTGVAKIPYRETIKGKVEQLGKYVKQSGGSGQYGIANMRFEHNKGEETPVFVDDIFGGAIPGNFIPAVEKGFREACLKGVLAGYPVINIKATVFDGKYHPVDSSELAFKMAAIFAFKDGCAQPAAKPTLLEPIYRVKVVMPNDFVGDIIGDLNKRRGLIEGMEVLSADEQQVTATVPQAELATYILDLNALTRAQASFTMEFVEYREVPQDSQKKIIEEARKAEEEKDK
ncbi:MAG: elongation factor G [Bacillales bacterium]|jgi:elongation factor G|nr:elongation factor G [Bacillales bacterium]